MAAYAFEALRFNPHNPALFRSCLADTAIAEGTDRRTVVRAGSTVVPMTISAMFDPDALDAPDEFRIDRPQRSYLHFGHGQHTCFGERLNRVIVPHALKALLCLENLRYSERGSRAIDYEGPFPDRMLLAFDVAR
jgi:cytochrome P450